MHFLDRSVNPGSISNANQIEHLKGREVGLEHVIISNALHVGAGGRGHARIDRKSFISEEGPWRQELGHPLSKHRRLVLRAVMVYTLYLPRGIPSFLGCSGIICTSPPPARAFSIARTMVVGTNSGD